MLCFFCSDKCSCCGKFTTVFILSAVVTGYIFSLSVHMVPSDLNYVDCFSFSYSFHISLLSHLFRLNLMLMLQTLLLLITYWSKVNIFLWPVRLASLLYLLYICYTSVVHLLVKRSAVIALLCLGLWMNLFTPDLTFSDTTFSQFKSSGCMSRLLMEIFTTETIFCL